MGDKIQRFEDLSVWKEAMQLVVEVYSMLINCKDYGLKDQVQRAAVSIPSNIAEGFERQSNKEFIHFLFIAKGSCGELRTQLYLIQQVGIISEEGSNLLIEKTKKVSAMLFNLIKVRKEKFT